MNLEFTNPFTDDFVRQEIEFMDLHDLHDLEIDSRKDIKPDGVCVIMRNITGRVDDFLNVNFRVGELDCPSFYIDGRIWMSLTPMEVQSNYLGWHSAHGNVAIGGLGIGYVALRAASNPNVDKVTVYENDPRVVKYFTDKYKDRSEMEKIEIIEGDARELLIGKSYDFVFMDIYQTLLPDEVLEDLLFFTSKNSLGDYRFWGEEKIKVAIYFDEVDDSFLTKDEKVYLGLWNSTEASSMYDNFYQRSFFEEYAERKEEALCFLAKET